MNAIPTLEPIPRFPQIELDQGQPPQFWFGVYNRDDEEYCITDEASFEVDLMGTTKQVAQNLRNAAEWLDKFEALPNQPISLTVSG